MKTSFAVDRNTGADSVCMQQLYESTFYACYKNVPVIDLDVYQISGRKESLTDSRERG